MSYREMRENAKWFTAYGTHSVSKGEYSYLPGGQFKQTKLPVAGAVAEYDAGGNLGKRTTVSRVAAGAVIAGPVGAIVGGLIRKDRSKGYVTVTFETGEVVTLDGPIRDEPKMRQFVTKVNAAGVHYAKISEPAES